MIVKIFHMIFGSLVLLNFIILVYFLLVALPKRRSLSPSADIIEASKTLKIMKILQHVNYTVVVFTGAWQIMQLTVHNVPTWVWAKIILFVVAISATGKAVRATDLKQMKLGLFIAILAYAGIVWLIIAKPTLNFHSKKSIQNQPVSTSTISSNTNNANTSSSITKTTTATTSQ